MLHARRAHRQAVLFSALTCAFALSACNGGWEVEAPRSTLSEGESAAVDIGVNRVQMPIRDAIYAHANDARSGRRGLAIIASTEPNLCARIVKQLPTADANYIQYTFAMDGNETRFYAYFVTLDPNADVDNLAYSVFDPCVTTVAQASAKSTPFGQFAVSGAHVQDENWQSFESSSSASSSTVTTDTATSGTDIDGNTPYIGPGKIVNRIASPNLVHNTFYLTGQGTVHAVMEGQTKLLQIETSLTGHTAVNTGVINGSFTASPCDAWERWF